MDKVRIFPQGEYVEKHKQLQEEWRKNFRDFAAKVGHMTDSTVQWIQLNLDINLISVRKIKPTTLYYWKTEVRNREEGLARTGKGPGQL